MRARLRIANPYNRVLPNVPVTYGVPVPENAAKKPSEVALLNPKGRPVAVSVQTMATWRNGSVRWALLDFCGDFAPNEKGDWQVAIGEGVKPPAPKQPVVVKKSGGEIRISNGRLEATFRKDRFQIIDTLKADGVEVIGAGCRSDIVAVSPEGKIYRASYDKTPKLSLEDVTPMRVVVRWDGGLFAGDGTRMTEYRLKLHFYAGNPYVKIEHSAVCREMPERGVMIREYRLDVETAIDQKSTKVVRQKNHGVDYFSRMVELSQNVHIKVPTTGADNQPTANAGILGAVGKPVIEDESAFQENVGEFPHFLKPGAPRVAIGGGYAVVYPFLGLKDSSRTIVGSILRMAPQHPKGMIADEGRMSFEIWPLGSGDWRLSRGMTKTHNLALSVFGKALTPEEIEGEAVRREYFAYGAHDPVTISIDPEYVWTTKQVESNHLLPHLPKAYPKLEVKIAGIQMHGQPLAYSGMMDYGEAISTNNEEDQGHEYAMEYYRSGSYDQYQKLVSQMLHNTTVDVVDWDPDPLRQGGTPYRTAYHQDAVCVPSHTWSEGMFDYAYVSGDREALRAGIGICEWILRYMKGKPQIVKVDGREPGWPIIALVAGYKATWDKRYLDAAYELVSYYKEKVEKFGELLNEEPPGTGYLLQGYGEYAGFEGMQKLWELTGDEKLRKFALARIEEAVERGHISFHSHGRMMDLYALYAAYDMSKDKKWIEMAKLFLPVALARPDWNGYYYRRVIQFLGMCHEHGLIDDSLVVLKDEPIMMTSRENVNALMRKKKADYIGLVDSPWFDTMREWVKEGYPTRKVMKKQTVDGKEIEKEVDEPLPTVDVFGYDTVGVGGWFDVMPLRGVNELVEETDEWAVRRNGAGAALKYWKDKSGTPEHIDFRMNSREVWERDYRPHLLKPDPTRVDLKGAKEGRIEWQGKNKWTHYGHLFIWEGMRQSMGDYNLYQSLILDPGWIHDYNRVYTDFHKAHYRMMFEQAGLPDGIWMYEDLGYKDRLLASPKVLKELIFPYFREMIEFFHSYDLPVVLHSCGCVTEALPLIVEVGFDGLNPMEVKAGCNVLKYAEQYGDKLAFVGGFDARIFESNDKALIRREVTELMKRMKGVGARWIFASDHSISYNTRYESYRHAVEVYREHRIY